MSALALLAAEHTLLNAKLNQAKVIERDKAERLKSFITPVTDAIAELSEAGVWFCNATSPDHYTQPAALARACEGAYETHVRLYQYLVPMGGKLLSYQDHHGMFYSQEVTWHGKLGIRAGWENGVPYVEHAVSDNLCYAKYKRHTDIMAALSGVIAHIARFEIAHLRGFQSALGWYEDYQEGAKSLDSSKAP